MLFLFHPLTTSFISELCFSHSTRLLAATTLRNVLGTKNLAEILSEREIISQVMQNALDEATDPWGVKVSAKRLYVLCPSFPPMQFGLKRPLSPPLHL